MSMLYKRDNFLNETIPYLFSNDITEFDIKSGGFSVIKHFKLVDDKFIRQLEISSKKRRQVLIGLYIRKNKGFSKILSAHFAEARKLFIETNNVLEEDIISIKKDAIITTKPFYVLDFGDIHFIPKRRYHSYLYLNRMELYFSNDYIDVKGIKDDISIRHDDFMLDFISRFLAIIKNGSRSHALKVLKDFAKAYRNRELETGYYREMNIKSYYRLNEDILGQSVYIQDIGDVNQINISYNYVHIILQLIKIFI